MFLGTKTMSGPPRSYSSGGLTLLERLLLALRGRLEPEGLLVTGPVAGQSQYVGFSRLVDVKGPLVVGRDRVEIPVLGEDADDLASGLERSRLGLVAVAVGS